VVASVAAIGVLIALVVVGHTILKSKTSDGGDSVTAEERRANAVTAETNSDFKVVCERGSVSNAAAYRKPYKIVVFKRGSRADDWSEFTLDYKAKYRADAGDTASINVVACMSMKAGSEVKSRSCEYDSGGGQVTVDHYAVEYDVELREANTGASIKNLGTVSGPANDCPVVALFDRDTRKFYGSPDIGALEAKLADFVAE